MNKINRLVGERVFGWAVRQSDDDEAPSWATPMSNRLERQYHACPIVFGPNFSTDISAAWEVREECSVKGLSFGIQNHHEIPWTCSMMDCGELFEARHESALVAICIAALKAFGVPEADIQEALR